MMNQSINLSADVSLKENEHPKLFLKFPQEKKNIKVNDISRFSVNTKENQNKE